MLVKKKIWTFWDVRPLPDMVLKSIASWRMHLKDWEVFVLDDAKVQALAENNGETLPQSYKSFGAALRSEGQGLCKG